MAQDEIDEVLERVRAVLVRWKEEHELGEVVIVVGQNQYEPQERPIKRLPPIKRHSGGKQIVRVR